MIMTTSLISQTIHEISFPSHNSLISWKLYDNPFYYLSQYQNQSQFCNPPLSTFVSDVTLTQPAMQSQYSTMQSELDQARAQIDHLKTKLDSERKLRKKAESLCKRLVKEADEERKKHEAVSRLREELRVEIESKNSAMTKLKSDIDEERKMMRVAEVWREERVQMKLEEARAMMEKKMIKVKGGCLEEKVDDVKREEDMLGICGFVGGTSGNITSCKVKSTSQLRRGSPVKESTMHQNPHIKRAIKGFVEEFPRAVRAGGSRGRHTGSNLECQRAQLRLLLKHKNPAGLGVAGPDSVNLVVN